MKNKQEWFQEYSISHQNETNQIIHYLCVPAIFLSIVGLFMSIPSDIISSFTKLNIPIIENWAALALLLTLFFYAKLGLQVLLNMFIFSLITLGVNYLISKFLPLNYVSIVIFIVAWIGQFYGHKIEGKKPSFFKDLQFLLIGPVWVIEKVLYKTK